MNRLQLILTCEHASNALPREVQAKRSRLSKRFFTDLAGHRGWDPGAWETLTALVEILKESDSFIDPVIFRGDFSRLCGDLNRREGSKTVFHPEVSRILNLEEQKDIIRTYHRPYRQAVSDQITTAGSKSIPTLHLAIHSFTPELEGVKRSADLGFLYDPRRNSERLFVTRIIDFLGNQPLGPPGLEIRRNYPYLGIQDGLPTWLRKSHRDGWYTGIEVEINQQCLVYSHWPKIIRAMGHGIIHSLSVLESDPSRPR